MLMSMLMSHASVHLFVLSFVLPCAYGYVAIVKTRLYSCVEILVASSTERSRVDLKVK